MLVVVVNASWLCKKRKHLAYSIDKRQDMVSKNPNMLPNMITKIIDMCIFFNLVPQKMMGPLKKEKVCAK